MWGQLLLELKWQKLLQIQLLTTSTAGALVLLTKKKLGAFCTCECGDVVTFVDARSCEGTQPVILLQMHFAKHLYERIIIQQ